MILKWALILILPWFFSNGFSQNNDQENNRDILRLTLDDARAMAIRNNRAVRSARLDVSTAGEKVWETVATGLPQLNFSANYQHQFTVPELSFGNILDPGVLPDGFITRDDIINAYLPAPAVPLGVRDNTIFDLTLSQLIFSGEYIVGLQAMKVLKGVSEKNLIRTENQTMEDVAGTYYLLLVLEENERVLEESRKATAQSYDELVRLHEEGFNEDTDVDQMKINLSNLETMINSISSQRDLSLKLLKFQLGLGFDQRIELTDSLSAIIEEGNLMYLDSSRFIIKNSIDYQLVLNQERISELMLKREKSKLLPVISAFYRHQEQTNEPAFNFAVKDIAGVSLNLPIITSGQRIAAINQAKFDLYKSRLNVENASHGLILEYETARNTYQTAWSNYLTNRQSVELSRKVYDRTMIKYREGVSPSFELAQNQAQFLTAESNYYNSVLTLLNAKARLDRILSGSQKQ